MEIVPEHRSAPASYALPYAFHARARCVADVTPMFEMFARTSVQLVSRETIQRTVYSASERLFACVQTYMHLQSALGHEHLLANSALKLS